MIHTIFYNILCPNLGIIIESAFICFSGCKKPVKNQGAKGCKWHLQGQNVITLVLPFTWWPGRIWSHKIWIVEGILLLQAVGNMGNGMGYVLNMVQICGDTQCRYFSINSQFYPNKSFSQECSTHSQHCERMRCDAPPCPPTAHLLPLVPRRAPVDAKVFPWESWPPASFSHANTESFNDSVTKRDTKSLWSTSWSSQLNLDTSLLQMHLDLPSIHRFWRFWELSCS